MIDTYFKGQSVRVTNLIGRGEATAKDLAVVLAEQMKAHRDFDSQVGEASDADVMRIATDIVALAAEKEAAGGFSGDFQKGGFFAFPRSGGNTDERKDRLSRFLHGEPVSVGIGGGQVQVGIEPEGETVQADFFKSLEENWTGRPLTEEFLTHAVRNGALDSADLAVLHHGGFIVHHDGPSNVEAGEAYDKLLNLANRIEGVSLIQVGNGMVVGQQLVDYGQTLVAQQGLSVEQADSIMKELADLQRSDSTARRASVAAHVAHFAERNNVASSPEAKKATFDNIASLVEQYDQALNALQGSSTQGSSTQGPSTPISRDNRFDDLGLAD